MDTKDKEVVDALTELKDVVERFIKTKYDLESKIPHIPLVGHEFYAQKIILKKLTPFSHADIILYLIDLICKADFWHASVTDSCAANGIPESRYDEQLIIDQKRHTESLLKGIELSLEALRKKK